ncbi:MULTISPECIES: hypothetical protein [unclassified Crossiella]|uniref:hypothetical protein n=1 Tax=unclassified Crossiella TaxID=2620835 RepID=UPI0020001251|nr:MULTISPECIES: hypothetical protein [unclassified Crossiella]MCK2241906.1 hypothetical protein [Crossiella sp. S99.2]MCK2255809.1 hypothetical protein [Crossiella sp. S99.1]
MTRYAYDMARRALLATWDVGVGSVAELVAELPTSVVDDDGIRLGHALTQLSRCAWRTYTHPASAAGSVEINTEGWRREQEREALAAVIEAIRSPHLPQGDGTMVQEYSPVTESAHQVGRQLHRVADSALVERIVADAEAELAAIEAAERGDFSGRARQAVQLTRADASPVQVSAADAILQEHPLGSDRLFAEVDPVAASVAAAHWLQAAADVAGEAAGRDPRQVVLEADDIEAIQVRTPTLVLERLNDGETPRQVVTSLIAEAMVAATGHIPDLAALIEQINEAEAQARRLGKQVGEVREALMPDRITTLDPARPAQDLLEDLLDGIRGCWLLYREYDDGPVEHDPSQDEPSEEDYDAHDEQVDEMFFDEVRGEAESNRERLL